MEILDISIGSLLLYGLVKGITKGFLSEIASLVALILGVYGAIHFSFYAKDILVEHLNLDAKYISLSAFALTFLAIIIGISLAGKLLTKVASLIALGWINKILGAFFGIVKIGFILSVVLGFVEKVNGVIPFFKEQQLANSILFTPVKNLAPTVFPKLLDQFNQFKKSNENNNEAKVI